MRHKLALGIRYLLQIISLLFFVYLLKSLMYPANWQANVLKWLSRLDPWGLIDYVRVQHAIPIWTWLPILVLILTLLLGRVFCGWFCPFGALMMVIDKIARLLCKTRILKRAGAGRIKVIGKLRRLRYYWLIVLLVMLIAGFDWAYSLSPFALFGHEIVDIMKRSVPWALILIVLMTILFSRLWCGVLCPTGLLLSLFGRFGIFRYRVSEGCVHCSKCSRGCPTGEALDLAGSTREGCLVCGECLNACPEKAIRYLPQIRRNRIEDKVEDGKTDNKYTRRQFIKMTGVGVLAGAVAFASKHVRAAQKMLRPPGAITEEQFKALCNRCGRCIQICPNNALKPVPLTGGLECYGTPRIIPREASCCLCFSCQEVCPTGAIRKTGLEQVHIGKAQLNKESCLAWAKNKLCLVCVEQCPMGAITYDDKQRPVVLTDQCIGCGSCERACALKGEAAIRVRP